MEEFFPYIDLKVNLIDDFKIKNIFNHKERLPVSFMNFVENNFSFASCDAIYVGFNNMLNCTFTLTFLLAHLKVSIMNHCHGCGLNQINKYAKF